MTLPRSNVVLMVFDDCHSSDAIDTFAMPKREQRVVCLLALALSDFIGDVVIHLFFSFSLASTDL